jgi:hypothetical protein
MSYTDCKTYFPHSGSLPDKVLSFFAVNDDEELSTIDIISKFGVTSPGAVSSKMAPLVRMGLLGSIRRGRLVHYTAGMMLADWAKGNENATANRPAQDPPTAKPLEIKIAIHVHGAGTPSQRIDVVWIGQ